ncbi:ClpP/crotonase-like domain-containing protein [Hygrophoropsis aurantiaca]|uniref:ClpP/crotonase-like domain-containing protein n=1 Tax=Hygrophoropsis aurantiaca TaxID=72124 RepID=A0ACB8AGH9_9AGAM|nr:ClpP/crotonase-like domain-containing protein [Hygrophoropsis aurantiaca]
MSLLARRLPLLTHPTRYFSTSTAANYAHVLVSRPQPAVALVQLNRPKALNALSAAHFKDITDALVEADADDSVGAMVLTGSDKAFAAGADILEMKDKTFADAFTNNFLANWEIITKLRKPLIAAVSGYALGGGCELALMCDIILASPTARFSQPEISIGVIPGGGGSQRLTRIVGKSRAMELCLTGRMFDAYEAERWGVVSRVVDGADGAKKEGGTESISPVVKEAVDMAATIASKGRVAAIACKEVINASFEMPLTEGLRYERRLFQSLFATHDQKEGMAAFAEKRKPNFTNS